ncbi:putative DNA binding domain-containing protein [Desulfococcaceae bacterium HSG8]|nr:putative DNA binding domain-containing protein [Desulfococcaceae bacterium HSG8]
MQIDETDIHDLLRQGENASLEFKEAEARPESIAKEIIAFANTNGGIILLGVGDDGTIHGLPEEKNYEEWVANIARNNVLPSVCTDFSLVSAEGKKIAAISVPKGRDKPYQTTDGKYLVRVGSTNRIATQPELLRLFQASGAFHYDLTRVSNTGMKDLNFTRLDNYFRRYELDFSTESEDEKRILLRNTDILSASGETTVGGLLIFGINPSRYLPQNGISFACFRGKTLDEELIDKQNIDGNLDYQIDTGSALVKKHLPVPSVISGSRRENLGYVYPDKVFRELLANATVHRNYAITGSKIRVFCFEDRLEVISPGRLPNTVTIEKLRFGVSFAVNPILVKFMENLRYVDQLGRGLPMVYQEAVRGGKNVHFKEIGEEFKVTLEI